ncbi:hypothetical protein PMG71_06910 [Roseofilum sp. BLCC_M154]|uniref:Uncharacterized protein n=1 Tax=Roseofilum acuticapitatum BLCC-M154 TaxID=3022444 RepID=A0ABT7AQH8_9CYAN|nr:hypothetical protein [Roseofilum acuticapitatum]MDJ1169151.1 hypothetical protein [Roseofilum acuticapitatum BLCC-M154]
MGRKAKLKHQRHQPQTSQPQSEPTPLDTTDFVKDLEKKGYGFKESKTAPEIPQHQIKPQL